MRAEARVEQRGRGGKDGTPASREKGRRLCVLPSGEGGNEQANVSTAGPGEKSRGLEAANQGVYSQPLNRNT